MTEIRLHGPPGCGKTTALAKRWIPDAVERFGAEYVVICSLTKTAAQEIASRGVPIPSRNVGTLHALAYRGLGKPTLTIGKLALWNQTNPALQLSAGREALDGQHIDNVQSATLGDKLLAKLEVLRHRMTPAEDWPVDVALFAKRWQAWKEEEMLVDFTDIIERAYQEITLCPGAPAVMIVDECQDSSALELRLVRAWGKHTSFFVLAGDGDQAIYEWRGASATAFYGGDLPEENNYHLTQSYRVPRAVHSVASEWIERAQERYAVSYKPRDFEGTVARSSGSSKNVAALVADIQADLDEGLSVMLLAPCAFSLHAATARLKEVGEAFHNPYRPSNGAWNPLRGGCDRVSGLLRPAFEPEEPLWSWAELHRWVEMIRADDLPKGTKARIKSLAALDKESGESNGLRNESEVTEMFGADFGTELLDATSKGPNELLRFFEQRTLSGKRKFVEFAFRVAEVGVHRLTETPLLTVGTIHSVKGGEADVVYLLPDLSPSGMKEWMAAGRTRDSVLRLFYVGMTRAKQKLVLCAPAQRTSVQWPAHS